MNRRLFLSGLAAVPLEPQVRRVYSFIWSNPLVIDPLALDDLNELLKAHYHNDTVHNLLFSTNPFLDLLCREAGR